MRPLGGQRPVPPSASRIATQLSSGGIEAKTRSRTRRQAMSHAGRSVASGIARAVARTSSGLAGTPGIVAATVEHPEPARGVSAPPGRQLG